MVGLLLSESKLLQWGDRGEDVVQLQKMLNATFLDEETKIDEDGVLGQDTYRVVCDAQREWGLAVDGVVGPQFTKEINARYEDLMRKATQTQVDDIQILANFLENPRSYLLRDVIENSTSPFLKMDELEIKEIEEEWSTIQEWELPEDFWESDKPQWQKWLDDRGVELRCSLLMRNYFGEPENIECLPHIDASHVVNKDKERSR